ncbi:hypothetical protein K458DRAFT_381438 [Lentithecium fluviatile CBS 122367]|uniref:Uncharacterized protein n=1 Tax=Lentithecium fluviatile CBS 122367 TaxID=1168545 RepID=A0A6G1JN63_9PLEO|nr:hypothetical protein K458DRAFT_381438 [Lentithecium fluviatile CBS 122367]
MRYSMYMKGMSLKLRDKIFAVLGLAHKKYQSAFPVKYSLTPEEIFTELAVHLIQDESSLAVLKYATGQTEDPDSSLLSSWVPRWDVKVAYDRLPSRFSSSELDMLRLVWLSFTLFSDEETVKLPMKNL